MDAGRAIMRGRAKVFAHQLAQVRERVRAIEQDVRALGQRLQVVETVQARTDAAEELARIEAEVGRIEADAQARQIEAEVEAAAIRLEATTPHYPRA